MALFKRKKGDEEGGDVAVEGGGAGAGDGGGGGGKKKGGVAEHDPEKARKFFTHARAMHESANYSYAMVLWLKGMKWDPQDMDAFESFFDSADNFMATREKGKGATKEQRKEIEGKDVVSRYLAGLLLWGGDRMDIGAGQRAMEGAAGLGLGEQTHWIGERLLAIAANSKKAKKETFVALMGSAEEVGDYALAERAGSLAIEMDPQDAKLIARVKNMSAQAAMERAGFEGGQGVDSGHFRRNIKDSSKQQELEEEESLSKTEETIGRLLTRAKTRVKSNPDDRDAWGQLIRLFNERGQAEDLKNAYAAGMKAYERFGEYRWRLMAGDVKMKVARQKLRGLRDAAAGDAGDGEKAAAYREFEGKVRELELAEYQERVENYPTDLKLRYELGKRLFESGRYEDAVEQFQRAKDASGLGDQVRLYLARAFMEMGWVTEAEDTYRDAIAAHGSVGDRLGLDLRYGLMNALERRGRDSSDMDAAKEALELAGKIAMQDFGYRDIKDRRKSLQGLVEELREG